MFIPFSRLATASASLLFLIGSCLGQHKAGVDQTVAVPEVQKILSRAQLSGSLEYWGLCDIFKPRPPELKLRPVTGHEGSALGVLQEMFADDPKMQVTQERDGKIRMVETDVPLDFLEIKIHHLSFRSLYLSSPSVYHSGAMVVYAIVNTPEVRDFMGRNIGPKTAWEGWGMPGQISIDGPSVPGELNDVTVAQALDYVLQTFPGFWLYQNCYDSEGNRKISVGFHKNLPVSDAPLPKTK
jgi:hypothetical protein